MPQGPLRRRVKSTSIVNGYNGMTFLPHQFGNNIIRSVTVAMDSGTETERCDIMRLTVSAYCQNRVVIAFTSFYWFPNERMRIQMGLTNQNILLGLQRRQQ